MPGPRRIVPVRAEVVRRKLATIREAVERLRPRASIGVEKLQQDGLLQWAVERGLQVAAKALFDAGNHILAGDFSDAADEYGQIPARLAAHGVLTAATAPQLTSLAGFTNVLVHDYAAIDLRRLVEGLARLGDFDAFVADVEDGSDVGERRPAVATARTIRAGCQRERSGTPPPPRCGMPKYVLVAVPRHEAPAGLSLR